MRLQNNAEFVLKLVVMLRCEWEEEICAAVWSVLMEILVRCECARGYV